MTDCRHAAVRDDNVGFCCDLERGHEGQHYSKPLNFYWSTGDEGSVLVPQYPGDKVGANRRWRDQVI